MSGRLFKYVDTAHKNRETTAGLNKIRGIARTLEIASSALSLKQYNEWLCFVVRWGVVSTVATRSLRINKCAEHQLHGGGWGQEMRNYSKQSEIFHSLTTHTPTRLCAKPPPIQCSTTNTWILYVVHLLLLRSMRQYLMLNGFLFPMCEYFLFCLSKISIFNFPRHLSALCSYNVYAKYLQSLHIGH